MNLIKNNITTELIINKSRFITDLIYINNVSDVELKLNEIKNKYKGASHYCFAYIIGTAKRFSDDGEPNGTAGVPILNILENHNLTNVLCVVTRYFGGVKLGAGGLVRAYARAAKEAIEITPLKKLINGKKIKIVFSYDQTKQIEYILEESIVVNKEYDDNITYIANISDDKLDNILNQLNLYATSVSILEDIIL